MEITVRRAALHDVESLLRLLRQISHHHHLGRPDLFRDCSCKYSSDELERIINDEQRPVFVAAQENGAVLGYAFCIINAIKGNSVMLDSRNLFIDDFCVDESVRGMSIGGKLFSFVKAYAKDRSIYNITLNVWEFNEGAVRFYENHGMKTRSRTMELIL